MRTSGLRDARDYNRGLAWPVRMAHYGWAVARPVVAPVVAWARDPSRRVWATPLLVCVLLFPIVYRLDPWFLAWQAWAKERMGGDFRREFEALQQYGQGVSTLLIAVVVWLQDPKRRRRLADWVAALVVAGVVVNLMKMLIGRPRPKYGDPFYWLGPLGQYPVDRMVDGEPVGIRHAWEFWGGISSDLWSMPSSHTCYVVIMAVVIGTLYPRLRWIVGGVAVIVGVGRIMTGGHWASDVLVGAALGLAIGGMAMERGWGQRFLDRAERREADQARARSTRAIVGEIGAPLASAGSPRAV
jgi:membrane-associated phospholipid phosphatase